MCLSLCIWLCNSDPTPPSQLLPESEMLQSLLKNKGLSSALHVNDFQVWPLPPAGPDSLSCCPLWLGWKPNLKSPGTDRGALLGVGAGAWQGPVGPGTPVAEEAYGRTGLLSSELGCTPFFSISLLLANPCRRFSPAPG